MPSNLARILKSRSDQLGLETHQSNGFRDCFLMTALFAHVDYDASAIFNVSAAQARGVSRAKGTPELTGQPVRFNPGGSVTLRGTSPPDANVQTSNRTAADRRKLMDVRIRMAFG